MFHFQVYRIAADFNCGVITKDEAKERLLGLTEFDDDSIETFTGTTKETVLRILSEE